MARRSGVWLALALAVAAVLPTQASALEGVAEAVPTLSAAAAQGVTFSVTGVVDGMTYYEPVRITVSAGGAIDIPPGPEFRLDGTRIYSGEVLVNTIGTHTLYMTAWSFGVAQTKIVTFTLTPPPQPWLKPVFRFYRPSMGTHFYTASVTERDSVAVNLRGTYALEGVAYWFDPVYNTQPLWRFYRPSTGTHFYTASDTEMQSVRANLAGTFVFEGPAYNVSAAPMDPPCATVYRFYNARNGTHFYTASESERDNVIGTLGHVYQFEGPAYYLAQ